MPTNTRIERPRSQSWAGILLMTFGGVVAANWVVAALRGAASGATDLAFAALLFGLTAAAAHGLRHGARWAWFVALAVAAGGLFFIAPVVGTILLGGGLEPVGTGWDAIYFPLMTALLVSVVILLVRGGPGQRSSAGQS